MQREKIAVVTGASSGIGREFAKRVCERYAPDELWAVARSKAKLTALQKELNVPTRIFPCDLTLDGVGLVAAALKEQDAEVCVLVNAAGYGKFGAFSDLPIDEQLGIIELNDKALVNLTYSVLPFMGRGGKIFMLGSLSSFQPVPYIAVYGASKAFVLSFSRALGKELEKKGIRVLAVSPGWVKTAFFDRAVRDGTVLYYNRFYTARQVADRAIADMERGRDVSICGAAIRAQALLSKLLPHSAVMSVWCRQQGK